MKARPRFRGDGCSEFAGDRYDRQLRKIGGGKRYLERTFGVPVISFIPPWNDYDENTCRALSAAGVHVLSAELKGPTGADLRLLPQTIAQPGLRGSVEDGLAAQGNGQLVVALIHPFDFKESGDPRAIMTLAQFDDLLGWLLSHENVRIATLADEMVAGADLTPERYRANLPRWTWSRLLPPSLRHFGAAQGVYLTRTAVAAADRTTIALVVALYAVIVLAAGGLGFLAARVVRIHHQASMVLLAIVLLAAAFSLMAHAKSTGLGYKALATALASVPAASGLLAGRLRYRRQEM
jgi:hypothetical protein